MLKKSIVLLVCLMIVTSVITGCTTETKIVENKINVYTSFFPLFDITRQIGGDYVNVINLIPVGVDPHDWTPKSREISDIGKSQLLIYNGAGLEGWIEDFKKSLDAQKGPKLVEASKGLDLIEVKEDEETHADEHGHEHGHGHEEEIKAEEHDHGNIDPHVWLSPLQVKSMTKNIYDALVQVDPANQANYEKNYNIYVDKLDTLHNSFKTNISKSKRKEMVVQHQAYGYLARDYGLTQMPIMGISADAEPTAQDMKKISDFVKKHNVRYILFEELVSDKVAKTLASDLDIDTLVFSPVEGLTEEQEAAGETYISLMEKNLENLTKALQ